MHAKSVLLVDHGKCKVVKGDVLLKKRMRADQKIDIAECETVKNLFTCGSAFAAGQDSDTNGGGFGERCNGRKMLTGENFRRCHKGCLTAGFNDGGGGGQGHNRFSGTDIALQQTQHSLGTGKISDDVIHCLLLRMRERIGQGLQDACAQAAFAGAAAAWLPAHVRSHQGERELPGEQFIVSKPGPCRVFRKNIVWLRGPVQMS